MTEEQFLVDYWQQKPLYTGGGAGGRTARVAKIERLLSMGALEVGSDGRALPHVPHHPPGATAA